MNDTKIEVPFAVLEATIRGRLNLAVAEESPNRTAFELSQDSFFAPLGRWELRGIDKNKTLLVFHIPMPTFDEVMSLEELVVAQNKTPEKLEQFGNLLLNVWGLPPYLAEFRQLPVIDRALRLFEQITVSDLPADLQAIITNGEPPYMLQVGDPDSDRVRSVVSLLFEKRDELWELREAAHQKILEQLWYWLEKDEIHVRNKPESPVDIQLSPGEADGIPAILLNRDIMKQFCTKSFDYVPKTAAVIINALPQAQNAANHEFENLTVTRLAHFAGCDIATASRYISTFKRAGFTELKGVDLPGR